MRGDEDSAAANAQSEKCIFDISTMYDLNLRLARSSVITKIVVRDKNHNEQVYATKSALLQGIASDPRKDTWSNC